MALLDELQLNKRLYRGALGTLEEERETTNIQNITEIYNDEIINTTTGDSGSLTVAELDGSPTAFNVNQILVSNDSLTNYGGGVVAIDTGGGGGGTPGGADTQVQFNDAGAFGGDSALVWNKTTDTLTLDDGSASYSTGGAFLSGGTSKLNIITSDVVSVYGSLVYSGNIDIIPGASTYFYAGVPIAETTGSIYLKTQTAGVDYGTINYGTGGDITLSAGDGNYFGGTIVLVPGNGFDGGQNGYTEIKRAYLIGNVLIGPNELSPVRPTPDFGGADGVILITEATDVPTSNPTTGAGFLYVESGALKYRGSSGTITTIANA